MSTTTLRPGSGQAFSFNPGTAKYDPENALALGRLARLAYEPEKEIGRQCRAWGLANWRFLEWKETQAFVAGNENMVAVAFLGTEPAKLQDWVKGGIEDLGRLGPDALKDHSMDSYVTNLGKNRRKNPFQ